MDVRPGALLALALLTGCSSGTPSARPATPLPTTASVTPTATPSRKPASKPPATPPRTTPPPATPPPATGNPIGIDGALVSRVEPGAPVTVGQGADCTTVFPDITRPTCAAITMDGGHLLWATGRVDGLAVVRLLVQDQAAGGYVTRYEGRDDGVSWQAVKVSAAPLTGHGTDGLVVFVRLTDGAATYDVLTWVAGGPLVLRAHRTPLADGRLAPRAGALDEYEQVVDGTYARRRVAWDGRRFRLSAPVKAGALPPR